MCPEGLGPSGARMGTNDSLSLEGSWMICLRGVRTDICYETGEVGNKGKQRANKVRYRAFKDIALECSE
jgi:hypothetical protein